MWILILVIIAFLIYYGCKHSGFSTSVSNSDSYSHDNNISEEEILIIIENADYGDKDAKEKLIDLFDAGLSSEQHNELRRKVYYSKALQGDSNAEYWMGFLTNMIDHDATASLQWFTKAASHGDVRAMCDLSLRYCEVGNNPEYGLTGFGVDEEKEWFWMKKAADAGHQKSQFEMGCNCKVKKRIEDAIINRAL